MPIFIDSRPQNSGEMGYIYDISMDDPVYIANNIIAVADPGSSFEFQGKVGDKRAPLHKPEYVMSPLRQGGMVAAIVPFAGKNVKVYFTSLNEMMVVPSDGDKLTADALIGADSGYYDDGYGYNNGYGNNGGYPQDNYNQYNDMNAQTGYPNEQYGAPMQPPLGGNKPELPSGNDNPEPMKMGGWFLTLILLAIPGVNLICMIVWLVSKKTNPSKKSYLKVQLIIWILAAIISAAVVAFGMSTGMNLINTISGISSGSSGISAYTNSQSYNSYTNSGTSSSASAVNSDNNTNTNANTNTNKSNTTAGEVGSLTQSDNDVLSVDAISQGFLDDKRVAIITMTYRNTADISVAPTDVLNITAKQGQNVLSQTYDETDGFVPATFDAKINAGASGTFQVCFLLTDDQDLTVDVINKDTKENILTAVQVISD